MPTDTLATPTTLHGDRSIDPQSDASKNQIIVRGVHTHNLKNISCRFPHGQMTVVTGVSGSGKSSLAFETVYQEGQRRYLQTFSSYARQFLDRVRRPPVDSIRHIQPTLALRQRNTITQNRSTVGTVTELTALLGLFFVSLGQRRCVDCDEPLRKETPSTIADEVVECFDGQRVVVVASIDLGEDPQGLLETLIRDGHARLLVDGAIWQLDERPVEESLALPKLSVIVDRLTVKGFTPRLRDSLESALVLGRGRMEIWPQGELEARTYYSDLRCNACGRAHPPLRPELFSFNTALGACSACGGYGRAMGLAVEAVIPNPNLSIEGGAVAPLQTPLGQRHQLALRQLCRRNDVPLNRSWHRLSRAQQRIVFDGDEIYNGVRAFFRMLEGRRFETDASLLLAKYRRYTTCEACDGTRLSRDARAVRVRGRDLGELSADTIDALAGFFDSLELSQHERERAGILPDEIQRRSELLRQVGVGYLTVDRLTRTLSSGEFQRIQLSSCIGRGLVDTCYVLDEPTTGLHARDSMRLVSALHRLRDLGNTVIVVEHDATVINAADHVIELGPGGGEQGGELLFEGDVNALRSLDTPTATALNTTRAPEATANRQVNGWLTLTGARAHNLKDATTRFPLGGFSVVSGVSGSGKSTLVFEVLLPVFEAVKRGEPVRRRLCDALDPVERFGEVIAMHHAPSGLTARSTVMSYIGLLEPVRTLLAKSLGAQEYGLSAFHFSTNVKGGRCDTCEGMGVQIVDMHFMADVEVTCETCDGKRFKPTVLHARLRGLNIDEIGEKTAEEAVNHFADVEKLKRFLGSLVDVGLGYVKLGQPTQSLSGGELQRLRIAQHLVQTRARRSRSREERPTLFLFDEPSVGLHAQDIRRLIQLFRRLRDQGHSVIAIDHNLDLIAAADWIVDLGPEAGDGGGEVVVQGPPAAVIACKDSVTGEFLKNYKGLG